MTELLVYKTLQTNSPTDLYKLSKESKPEELAPVINKVLNKHYGKLKENKIFKDNLISLVNLIYIKNQAVNNNEILKLKNPFTHEFLAKIMELYAESN